MTQVRSRRPNGIALQIRNGARPVKRNSAFPACSSLALAVLLSSFWLGAHSAQAQVFTTPVKPAQPPKPRPQPARRPTAPTRPVAEAPAIQSNRVRTYNDPAAFCAANPNVDQPGSGYAGPAVPDWIASALSPAGPTRPASANQTLGLSWRCFGGRVLACNDVGGKAECAQPDQSLEPTPEILTYCISNRNLALPLTVTRQTIPVWICRNGRPTINGYRSGLDQRGFFAERWRDVTDFAPANMVAAVPRAYIGDWNAALMGKGTLFKIPYTLVIKIRGGNINGVIGSIDYYSADFSGRPAFRCSSNLYLKGGNPALLEIEERIYQRTDDPRCAAQDSMTMQPRDGKLWLEWRKNGNSKITMSGWANR